MKKGQFYLVTTIIVISVLVGFASLENVVQKKSSVKFYYFGEELRLESENVLDYAVKQNIENSEWNDLMINFTQNHINYSEAENFYFLFGDNSEITFAGYQKSKDGTVVLEGVNEQDNQIELTERVYHSEEFTISDSFINMTVPNGGTEDLEFDFEIKEGENFYFVISQDIGGDRYIATNE